MKPYRFFYKNINVFVIFSSLIFVLISSLIIVSELSNRASIDEIASRETEYQSKIFSTKVNENLLKVDNLLRNFLAMTERPELPAQNLSDKIQYYLRKELLLTPNIAALYIINSNKKVIWKSPGADIDDPGVSQDLEYHNLNAVDFSVNDFDYGNSDDSHIHLSRSLRNDKGEIILFINAAVSTHDMFPSDDDLYFTKAVQISLVNDEMRKVVTKNYENIPEELGIAIEEMLHHPPNEYKIQGGQHVYLTKRYAIGLFQLDSFPFYTLLAISLDEWLQLWKSKVLLSGFLTILVGIVFGLSVFLFYQRFNSNQIRKYNTMLTESNQNLQKISSERKLLIQEVHHRVKNNLSLINNIIEITIMNGGPYSEQTLKDINARIRAIQKVHSALYHNSDFSNISAKEYLEELSGEIVSTISPFPVNLEINVSQFFLPTDKILPLGIIIAELLTNSIKYGVEPGGRIRINGVLNNNNVIIEVANDGKPYKTEKAGLGTLLINSLVEQLSGEIELETGKETIFKIHFILAPSL